ncbi:MAG: hypothetical protein V8T87_04745 [Victivallales bacterium]
MEKPSYLVKMDSLNYTDLRQGQQIYFSAQKMLSPTALLQGEFRAAGHGLCWETVPTTLFAGTATIDSQGQVVHPYDVAKQTERLVSRCRGSSGKFRRELCPT